MSLQSQDHREFEIQQRYSALIRSISGDTSLELRDWKLFQKSEPYYQLPPHLRFTDKKQGLQNTRGIQDGIALRIKHSDRQLHQQLMPNSELGSFIFEVLEQIRAESMCPAHLKGIRQNTQYQFLHWLGQFMANGQAESAIGLLLLAIVSMVWVRLTGRELPQPMQDTLEATRAGLATETGPLLENLKKYRDQQLLFAQHALKLIDLISNLIHLEYASNPSLRAKQKNTSGDPFKIEWIPPKQPSVLINPNLTSGLSKSSEIEQVNQSLKNYRIFNPQYDQEIRGGDIARNAQLQIYRHEINQQIAKWNIPWGKLVRLDAKLFSKPLQNKWLGSQEDGALDQRYLNQLITSTKIPAIFKKKASSFTPKTQITFLLDCSGSMKDQRLILAAWVDSMVQILEKINIQTEILGYSTLAWQGGRPYKEWLKKGKPTNPGRLNERAHWIFKDAKTSWKDAKFDIAALLKPDLYRESLDGEALIWASERLNQYESHYLDKKIILLSDGCPMDRATLMANPEDILSSHLVDALKWAELHNHVQVWGCGVGKEMRSTFSHRLSWGIDELGATQLMKNWALEFNH